MPEVRVRKRIDKSSDECIEEVINQKRIVASSTHSSEVDDATEKIKDRVVAESAKPKQKAAAIKKKAMDKTPKKLKNPSELQVRIRTGVIYISLTVVCILASNVTSALYLALLSAICAGEFYLMLRSDAKLPNELLGVIAAALFPIAMWLFGIPGVVITLVVFILVLLVWYVFWLPARVVDVAVSLFGAIYTGLTMSSAMMLRMSLPEYWGGLLVLGIFLSIWANDAFAYLVGSAIGRHKLAPSVSPKKSWEGFIAGLIASMGFWCLLTLIPSLDMTIAQALFFGFVCGLAGVLGDLVESRIKRNSGVKDSGTIMPGHGGLLDRCDSQFLVTMLAALLMVLFHCISYTF